jgi:hypothetical protein
MLEGMRRSGRGLTVGRNKRAGGGEKQKKDWNAREFPNRFVFA